MRGFIDRFLRDEDGATAIEYGLICALIFLAIVGALTALSGSTGGLYGVLKKAADAMK